ncbi:hypothetical protein C5167_012005 [Papaver somniferum]|uniref:FAD-binding PCMH-type domain-containing protein n=1 Tax=Papaver somniferum TaxID=3469 RepID=A0A4Y7IZF6_PAPSO|nr:hypothetical protein C5167_012005 [Papaver somniferum]
MAEDNFKLVFAINGERVELLHINDHSTTLLEFIRTQTRFTGTMLSCGEVGAELALFFCQCKWVFNYKGLGSITDGFHTIHKRMSGFHASQCGFCTPGMCMSLFSALVNAEKTQTQNLRPGFSKLTESEAERLFQSGSGLMFETYRAAPRPLGNTLAYLNAAFLAEVSLSKVSGCSVLEKLQLAFGAYGTKHAIRVRKVEEFLIDRSLSKDVLLNAINILRVTIIPDEGTSSPAYRSSLTVSFLFDFLHPLKEVSTAMLNDGLTRDTNSSVVTASKGNNSFDQRSHVKKAGLLSSGKQVIKVSTEFHPVGQPTKKSGAENQASGEAVYVDDIPSPKDCLHGAMICSKMPLAWIKNVKLKSFPSPDGVVKVADTQKHADMAADSAMVEYDTENLEPPIL